MYLEIVIAGCGLKRGPAAVEARRDMGPAAGLSQVTALLLDLQGPAAWISFQPGVWGYVLSKVSEGFQAV